MHLYTSNRAELLVTRLAEVMRRPSGGPFNPEIVLVQSPGMGAWLSQKIAHEVGICANVEFPFPSRFLPKIFADVLGSRAERAERWTRSRVQWAIIADLPERLSDPDFAEVARYLVSADGDVDSIKLMQLAARIARVFSGYLYYRPQMVERWQGSSASTATAADTATERWQAKLWRGVRARLDAPNVVELAHHFRAWVRRTSERGPDDQPGERPDTPNREAAPQLALDFGAAEAPRAEVEQNDAPPALPTRVCLFGISSLPPLQLALVGTLAKLTEVHVFVLSPSKEFFADIRDARAMARARATEAHSSAVAPEDEHLEIGNPLLASLGKLGRDFQHLLYDVDLPVELHTEDFLDPLDPEAHALERGADWQPTMFPTRPSALAVLQSDVLNLRHRGYDDGVPPFEVDTDDRSIAVHACHGAMRQVEVLHDQLLDLFRRDPTLTPADVLVMSPDLETYGPLVEAVFDRGIDDIRSLPYRIADRSLRRESPVAEAFLGVLDVIDGRFGAPEVMDLLSMSAVHRFFGVASDDLPRVAEWIMATGIRWGIDAEHRESHGQPAYEENTWRFGLDRLLLGSAMVGADRNLFAGVLPFDGIEGHDSQIVGRLTEFFTTLTRTARRLDGERTMAAWRDDLGRVLDELVASDDDSSWQHEQIRRLLSEAAEESADCGVAVELPLAAVRNMLRTILTDGRSSYGFLTGAITFCEMLPMRAIPFRVVCMLGMDERAFPRNTSRLGFDLVSRRALRGDRNSRDDDRYLFLEALLSARDRFILTYTGQSVRDNAPLPPSVVVSELLDACEESFGDAGTRVVTKQALQPFSERYFRADDPLFTYAHEFHSGAESLLSTPEGYRPFVSAPAPLATPIESVSVRELVQFFRNPVRAFFNKRLQVYLEDDAVALLDREPIVLDKLESSILAGRMLDRATDGENLGQGYDSTRAEGALPLGVPGGTKYELLAGRIGPLNDAVLATRQDRDVGLKHVELEIAGLTLGGRIRNLFDGQIVRHQYNRVRGDHELALWVEHLILLASGGSSDAILIGRPSRHSVASQRGSRGLGVEVTRYRPPENAVELLADLVDLYRAGMEEPLLLFPRTGMVWQEHAGASGQWREASRAWDGPTWRLPGEGDNRYANALLAGTPPFRVGYSSSDSPVLGSLPSRPELKFKALAERVFGPLLAHRDR